LVAAEENVNAALGVVTPRLTRSSLFTDPLFRPSGESAAALLVRGLVLRRLVSRFDSSVGGRQVAEPARKKGSLRVVPARIGEKVPEASPRAAIRFILDHPDPTE